MGVDTGSGGLCCLGDSVLELDGPIMPIVERRPAAVVDRFDIFDPVADGELSGGVGWAASIGRALPPCSGHGICG